MYTVLLFILYNHISFLPLTLRETRLNLNGFFMEIYMIFRYSSLRINLQDIGTAYIFFFIRKDSLSDIIQLRRGTEKRMSEKKAIICIHYAFYVVSVFLHLIQRNNRASNLSFICKGGILMSTTENRGQFGSKLGFILSAAGSAVGLGNIWKFPGKAYNCGGGAFLLVYIIMVALIGTTVMMAEFTVGRNAHKNALGSFRAISQKWGFAGGLGVLTGFIILCYYCQVGGWAMKYIVAYIVDVKTIWADPTAYFLNNLLGADGTFPLQGAVIFPFIFLFLTAYIISHGTAGIEKMSKLLMPLLFIMLIALMIRSCTLPGADDGLKYMLNVDFSTINGVAILTALGQAFFSLSLGMGVMMTYASYLSNEDNLISNTGIVCVLDTLVALFAGFMIIPAVFATGIDPGMGGGFAFATLAGVFEAIPGGTLFGLLFYFLLFFAAVTSSTSIMEGTIAFLIEEKGLKRNHALLGTSVVVFIIGVFYTLSQVYMNIKGIWVSKNGIEYPIFGDFLEYLTDRLLLPLGAFFTTVFVGWIWGTDNSVEEATSYGKFKFTLAPVYKFIVKILDPIAIGVIIIAGLVFGMSIS